MLLPKLFFISILSSLISATGFTHSYSQCLDDQKSLLLQLKNELIFNSSLSSTLVRWNQTHDCCKWYGVECDYAGYVISLQLGYESISGGIGDSSSLFRLKYLKKLNLAYNDFGYSTPIPKGIHNLNYLTHLDFSNAGFGGQVPLELSSLKRLVSLDISNVDLVSDDSLKLEYPNLETLLQNMTGLRELYLDGVNITSSHERTKWSHIISSYLPHLTTLSLVQCSLSGPLAKSFWQLHSLSILRLDGNNLSTTLPNLFANFPSLTTLTLSECSLKGSFPNKIIHIPTLQNIDLSYNHLLSGSLPTFPQNGSLESIKLIMTNFSGSIPSSISNLKTLSELKFSGCKFTGSIPSTFANLTQLTHIDLSDNSFSGKIPHCLFGLPSLETLYLSNNHFTGKVEEFSIGINASNIFMLDLSRNQLEGPIHDSLFQLQSLEDLWLSDNLFSGTFQLEKIQSLANLGDLDLSRNNLSIDVSNDNSTSYGFPQLIVLSLASCNLNDFPDFIKHSDISILDLSNNGIGGEIPSWIWRLTKLERLNLSLNLLTGVQKPYHIPSSLFSLDLSSNQLRGELNMLIPRDSELAHLFLANNSLSGSIPTSLCTATQLDILDLSVNKLSGTIPSCLLHHSMISLMVLDLGRNNISGSIPDNFSLNCRLGYFDLNNNTLEGEIPRSLKNCKSLLFMNVGNNDINDTFPCMLPSSLRVLALHSNRFHGEVRCHISWPDLQILDISSNNFSGSLEIINFSGWSAMVQLSDPRFRYNNLLEEFGNSHEFRFTMKGLEVDLVKIWSDFNTIDFSCNNFHGEIPNAIGDLSLLRLLNFSHNALNGSIPKSFGQLRKLESLDLAQNQLTGAIPMELTEISFLSFLNLSYNMLVGEIPNDRHFQTFSADSFKGNPGLCGFNLDISCSNHTVNDSDLSREKEEDKKGEIEWDYVSAALGYVVGLGSIVWLLLFCRSFRKKYFDKIDDVVEQILDARDMRRRRRATARRRVVRNETEDSSSGLLKRYLVPEA